MLEMEGSDGDCGRSCCLFARSGETGKRGVPGDAGKLNTGSMRVEWTRSDFYVRGTKMQVAKM